MTEPGVHLFIKHTQQHSGFGNALVWAEGLYNDRGAMILEVTSMVAAEELKGLMGEPPHHPVERRPHDIRDAGEVEAWQPARATVGQAPVAGEPSPRSCKEDEPGWQAEQDRR